MTPIKRHGLLTTFLIFQIVVFGASFLTYAFAAIGIFADGIWPPAPNTPRWAIPIFCIGSVVGIVSVVAIFRWMKWGFYVLCGMAVVILPINLYSHVPPIGAFLGLLGPLILYGLLQLGRENNAWSHLR